MEYINSLVSHIPHNSQECVEIVVSAKMWPLFVLVHYLLVAISMRSRTGSRAYAFKHPFASWLVCVTSCFGGQLLTNIFLGRPIIQIYENNPNLLLASFIWYLVFFSPLDMVNKVTKIKFIKAVLLVLKEIHRVHSIKSGVEVATSIYFGNTFIIVLIGAIRGSGSALVLHPFDAVVRGSLLNTNEILKPGFTSKHAMMTGVLLVLQHNGLIGISEDLLVFLLFTVAAIIQLLLLFTKISDPYIKLEELLCAVFLLGPNEVAEETKKKLD